VETSQQQRRSKIGQLASVLAEADITFDVLDLVDALWLAQFIESENPNGVLPEQAATPNLPTRAVEGALTDLGGEQVNLYVPEGQPPLPLSNSQELERDLAPKGVSRPSEQSQGLSFAVPSAPALRTRIDLARAMRPLMRKVPSRQRFDLDEEATVTQIAETEVWIPVVRARPERWLELDLVVEDARTTAIWERSIDELAHLAEYQGAFRAVRTWRLRAAANEVQLFPRWSSGSSLGNSSESVINQRPRTPRELIDPSGRRLIWVVTDCTSLLWQQPEIYQVLLDWSRGQSVSIMQMLPERLWSRTALRNGYPVELRALVPGVANAQLEVEGLPRRLMQRGDAALAMVPVVNIEPERLAQWAGVVAGMGDMRMVGRAFDIAFIRKQIETRSAEPVVESLPERTAAQRVALFRSTSSRTVRKLANLMAAVPVSLPVIDLLREAFRGEFEEEVRQSHVAEVLLSGLLRRCDMPDELGCRYEFFGDDLPDVSEKVRDILLRDASIKDTRRVLDVLSVAIYRQLGRTPKNFEALLSELQESRLPDSQTGLRAAALPFARVGIDVLLKLGGEHAAFARQVQLQQVEQSAEESLNFPPLADFEFNQLQLVDDPWALSTEVFIIRTLERQHPATVIETFETVVATLSQANGEWQVQRQQQRARRFVETLPDGLALEMVAIPGGTFLMGSSADEAERYDNESPQQEITVKPFFMGRYPVTQAQWRLVATMPQVERELNSMPSHFKGDHLPTENVSWYDAAEFCNRLSVHTGRQYRLPTEAEWEYACRSGTTTPFHFGEMITRNVANYGNGSYAKGPKGRSRNMTTQVGEYGTSNAFGLSDLHGNVWEWCQDDWHDSYRGLPTDGGITNDERNSCVVRGGSWVSLPSHCRSASRHGYSPLYRYYSLGFRVSCGQLGDSNIESAREAYINLLQQYENERPDSLRENIMSALSHKFEDLDIYADAASSFGRHEQDYVEVYVNNFTFESPIEITDFSEETLVGSSTLNTEVVLEFTFSFSTYDSVDKEELSMGSGTSSYEATIGVDIEINFVSCVEEGKTQIEIDWVDVEINNIPTIDLGEIAPDWVE
jgi:formylglycine-generating enzyme required for sulfatase activity